MFSLFKQVASVQEAALSELSEEQLSDVAGGNHHWHHRWNHRHHRHNWNRHNRHNTWRSSSSRGGWNGGYSSNSGYSGSGHW